MLIEPLLNGFEHQHRSQRILKGDSAASLINPSDKRAEHSVKLVHRDLCIAFPFRPPFFFARPAVFLDPAQ